MRKDHKVQSLRLSPIPCINIVSVDKRDNITPVSMELSASAILIECSTL